MSVALPPEAIGEDEADGFAMTNLPPRRTGLPFVVFVSQRGGARHDVRVKICETPEYRPELAVSVALRPDVRVVSGALSAAALDALSRWIALNREALIDYWDGRIEYTEDLLALLKPLPR